jgi:hypothetical protein
MKRTAIDTLRRSLPNVFPQTPLGLPDDLITRDSTLESDLSGLEEILLEDVGAEPENLDITTSRAPLDRIEPRIDRDRAISSAPEDLSDSHNSDGTLREPYNQLPSNGDYPGVPSPITRGQLPPVDALAFYLPFHRFSPNIYGIYLLAGGVKWLTKTLFYGARQALTPRESLRLAKAFLFHHEAYHNAVEVFSTHMELAHRFSIYETGARRTFQLAPSKQHEEALATAYAIEKAKNAVPKTSRKFARALLIDYVLTTPPPYCFGAQIGSLQRLKACQSLLQESVLTLSSSAIKAITPGTWAAGLHLMNPSLARGNKFSYLLRRDSYLAQRLPLGAVYFADRRKLIQKLKAILGGGQEIPGGRHPIFLAPDGTRIPIPYGKQVDEGTLSSILKRVGISIRPREFMRG